MRYPDSDALDRIAAMTGLRVGMSRDEWQWEVLLNAAPGQAREKVEAMSQGMLTLGAARYPTGASSWPPGSPFGAPWWGGSK